MIRTNITLIIILIATNCFCQFNDIRSDNYIIWSDSINFSIDDFQSVIRPDFTSEPGNEDSYCAMARCKIQGVIDEYDDNIDVQVFAAFHKKGSWFDMENVDSSRYSEVLNHEKGHFDLTEISVRRIRQGVDSLNALYCVEKNKYEVLIDNSSEILSDLQDLYDKETWNGLIVHKQEEWDKKIADLLSSLSEYSSNMYD